MTQGGRFRLSRRTMLGGSAVLAAAASRPGVAMAADAISFPVVANGIPANVLIDAAADPAVQNVAASFKADLDRVSGGNALLLKDRPGPDRRPLVVIGVVGQSALIDRLVADGRLSVDDLKGRWEAFRRVVVRNPFPGVRDALFVIGSDRRGAVYGTYDLSERMGVSPWHWFADVPVVQRRDLRLPIPRALDEPKVRYRGFFINDEDPCLSGWARKAFGGVNAAMYAHVFELLLRMKGNYLWPAMWGKAFALDDPNNVALADSMGVVMGNSHHEPMLRAQSEWHRGPDRGQGPWDYARNRENLRTFWRGGIERMMSKGDGRGYESVVTVGMRGDGDEAMGEGTAIGLLEGVVSDQRRIIAEVTGRPAEKQPQLWALYKEVQDYYDRGMKVPDDVILLFSDDNWGQIRRLPPPGSPRRQGGYGVYYHFDYVGGPRNYKWINTNQVEKVWQQMDLAYRRDARAMWIVNVGDIKPMEYPLGFFLAMAWNPEAMDSARLASYPREWAAATFGAEHGDAIGRMVTDYGRYAARRKPELIDQDSFPLGGVTAQGLDGGEFGELVAQWDALETQMLRVRDGLRADQRAAYFQLLEYPIGALANLYRLYYATAWNRALAADNDPRANYFADQVERTFARDADLTRQYHSINGGKWDGMMAQVHMSYVTWNDPTRQTMPSIVRVGADTPTDRQKIVPRFVPRSPAPAGVVAIEAVAFTRTGSGQGLRWTRIPHLGRTQGALVALPQGLPPTGIEDGVWVEYGTTLTKGGDGSVTLYLAPTLDTLGGSGVKLGLSIDDGPVRIVEARLEPTGGPEDTDAQKRWSKAVSDNVVELRQDVGPLSAGRHRIRIWRIDDNVVLQKLVLATVPVAPSYLGPPPPA